MGKNKTEKQVLEQTYMSANDLLIILPTMGENARLKFIAMIRSEMEQKGYFVPPGKPHLALTEIIKERLGIKNKNL